jgi:hypothetical protein
MPLLVTSCGSKARARASSSMLWSKVARGRKRRNRRWMLSILWLSTSGRASSTCWSASQLPSKSGMSTSIWQSGTRARISSMLRAKMCAPPSGASSRLTEVSTANFSRRWATESATRSGSRSSIGLGLPLLIAQ